MNAMPMVVQTILEQQPAAPTIRRGLVMTVHANSSATVLCGETEISCEVLQTAAEPLHLSRGDVVLIWMPAGAQPDVPQAGVILGRIGPSHASAVPAKEAPEELVIEAKQNLVLKCGAGSITLRADGKVLIKGKDLVSHAQRQNRIKGGSVAIN